MGLVKLALYYPWLYLTSGAERTIVEIARRSRHRVTIFTNEYQPNATFPELARFDVRVLDRIPVDRSISSAGIAASRILRQRVDLSSFDALLVVCEGLGDLMTLRHRIPAFCLCLTPLRIVFDPVYRSVYLANRGLLHRGAITLCSSLYKRVDRLAWRRYRRVFPISQEVRQRILAGGLCDDDKLEVLNPGVDLQAFLPSPARERVFFVPGRIMWTKNLELAIRAFQRFRDRVPEGSSWRLRIAGIVDKKSESYLTRLRTLAGSDPTIEFLIRPTDEQMRTIYRDCYALLFTAFNEDWGLVIIEGLASGKPPIAVDCGGPREIVRHGIDGLLTAAEPEAFANAMLRLATNPELYSRLSAKGPSSAARFGWNSFVEKLDERIESSLALPSTRTENSLGEARA